MTEEEKKRKEKELHLSSWLLIVFQQKGTVQQNMKIQLLASET